MKISLPLFFFFILASCSSNFERDKDEIKKTMDKQVKCWSNGDLDGYMDGYWKSDSLRFLGRKGLRKGWQTTLNNYKKAYPDKSAMGKLIFNNISFEPLNNKQMFVVGEWILERENDTLSGYYSLIWEKIDGQWEIIFDHTN